MVSAGTGDKLAKGNRILFDYLVVDGRTGAELGSSFGATPVATVLDATQTAKGLVTGLVGASVGSRVLIALSPKEGLAANAQSNGAKNVKKDDTLLFVVDVKGVRTPLARATGEAVTPADGLPVVTLGDTGKPSIKIPDAAPPRNSSCNRSSPAPAPRSPRARRSPRTTPASSTGAARTSPRPGSGARRPTSPSVPAT